MVARDPQAASPDPSLTVSVIIPCYRAAAFVVDAVKSVLAQNVPGLEILVINDGSPDADRLAAVLEPFMNRIRYLDEPHRGLPGTRNRGIEVARGRFLAFLDADDVWKADFLDRQLQLLRESGADMVYCDAELFGEAVPEGGTTVMDAYPSRGEPTAASILTGDCLVVMSTIVVRAETVRSVDGFDAGMAMAEDLDLWIRIAAAGASITYHRGVLAGRRIHGTNMSSREAELLQWVMKVTARHVEVLPLTRAVRRRLGWRVRGWRARLHLLQAKTALVEEQFGAARRELWASCRARPTLKVLVVAIAFSLYPSLAHRLFKGRYEPD